MGQLFGSVGAQLSDIMLSWRRPHSISRQPSMFSSALSAHNEWPLGED